MKDSSFQWKKIISVVPQLDVEDKFQPIPVEHKQLVKQEHTYKKPQKW